MDYIQGESRNQYTMLPNVMDDYITEDNTVRIIDAFVDSLDIKKLGFNKSEHCETGRPPYAPQDLLKLYIYGYFNHIRSSRRLEAESKRNIETIWLLKKLSPDHKTISRFRSENKTALKKVFRSFVKLCDKLGLYGKELISIDGSKFSAVNSKERNFNDKKLEERIARIDEKISKYLSELDENDCAEKTEAVTVKSAEEITKIISELKERKETYENMRNIIKETGETQVSLTDPDSRRMNTFHGNAVVAYNVQTAVDDKNKLIADFNVTNNPNDRGTLHDLASECKSELEIDGNLNVVADNGFDSPSDIMNCMKDNITANVSMDADGFDTCIETSEDVPKPTEYTNGRCIYIKERNIVVCPMGEILKPGTYSDKKRCAIFYNGKVCSKCKQPCSNSKRKQQEVFMPKNEFKKEFNADGLKLKQIHYKPDKVLLKKRKTLSEHPFGFVKRCMGMDYLLTKGFNKVESEFSLAFMVFNLKRAINLLGIKKLIYAIKEN